MAVKIKLLHKYIENLDGYAYVYRKGVLTAAWDLKKLNCSGLCFIFYTITKIYDGADLIIFQHGEHNETKTYR